MAIFDNINGQLQKEINELNSNMEWKELLDSGTSVTLPTQWNELHVVAWITQYSALVLNLLPSDFIESPTNIGVSRVTKTESMTATFSLFENELKLVEYLYNGTNYNSALMRVHYR